MSSNIKMRGQQEDSCPPTRRSSINNNKTKNTNNNIKPIEIKCKICEEICIDNPSKNDEWSICCNICNHWFHRICTNITLSSWITLSKNPNIHYICDQCVGNKAKSSSELSELKKIIEDNQKENRTMIANLETRLFAQVDKMVEDKLREHDAKNVERQNELESVIKEMRDTEVKFEKNIEVQVKKYMDNKEEKEMKKNNIIIHKLNETLDNEKDQQEKDKSDLINIIETTTPEFKAEIELLIKNENAIKRLGTKKTGNARPRPIKVTLPDEEMKRKIFKGCKNLKDSPFKEISIQEDLTREEQEKNYQLRRELKERREKGEKICIFRGSIIPESEHPANRRK